MSVGRGARAVVSSSSISLRNSSILPSNPKALGMAATSPHLTSIPQAVRVAASIDPSIDPGLKQQAIDYLTKVKQLSEETWQVSICNIFINLQTVCLPATAGLFAALPSRSRRSRAIEHRQRRQRKAWNRYENVLFASSRYRLDSKVGWFRVFFSLSSFLLSLRFENHNGPYTYYDRCRTTASTTFVSFLFYYYLHFSKH